MTRPRMQTIATLCLSPHPDALTRALDWIRTLARERDWPEAATFRFSLCMDEALSNILQHGYPADTVDGRIILTAFEDAHDLVLQITDDGKAFDPTALTPSPLAESVSEAELGGHGLRLLRHYLKDLQYSRANGRNQLHLILARDSLDGRA